MSPMQVFHQHLTECAFYKTRAFFAYAESHQPTPPPGYPENTADGWPGGGVGWFRRIANCTNGLITGALALALLGGCGTTYERRDVTYKPTELMRPASDVAENKLLGVRIQNFESGKFASEKKQGSVASEEIRKAEGYFIAVKLKDTMQGSGHWGPVRVVPASNRGGEVAVTGRILESDGESLKLEVNVGDATGANWFKKEYGAVVSTEIYKQSQIVGIDAFQFLYNQIANDIARHRQKLADDRVLNIRRVAELKFAADLAPKIFSVYLKDGKEPATPQAAKNVKPENSDSENGDAENGESDLTGSLVSLFQPDDEPANSTSRYTLVRLPSANDPMFRRVKGIRAREHLLVDTLDQQYEGMARSIDAAYTQWRVSRLTEMNSIRKMEELRDKRVGKAIAIGIVGMVAGVAIGSIGNCNGCATTGGILGGTALNYAFQQSIEATRAAEAEAVIHKAALEEASHSLAAEVRPIVVEVQGETIALTGSVEAKFEKWRQIITKIYQREIGPIQDASPPSNPEAMTSS